MREGLELLEAHMENTNSFSTRRDGIVTRGQGQEIVG